MLARLLTYEDAACLAARLGLHLSDSALQQVVAPVAQTTRQLVRQHLEHQAEQPLEHAPARKKRVMVIQTDGVIVLGRTTGKNVTDPKIPRETGEAIEVKTPDGLTESMRKRPRCGMLFVRDNRNTPWGRSSTLPVCLRSRQKRLLERYPER